MKILYLHQYFNTPKMSGGTRSYEMARRLVSMGHEVHMVTSWCDPIPDNFCVETQEDGINVYWLPVRYNNKMNSRKRIMAFLKFVFLSARKATSIEADLVFASSTPLTIALPAVYAARKHKVPMVFEVRDLWPEMPIALGVLKDPITRFLARRLEKFAYNNAAAVVALSPGMRDGVIKTGYSHDKVAVIPNGSDIKLFQDKPDLGKRFCEQRDWLKDKPLLIYTGAFGLVNGVNYMVGLAKTLLQIAPDIRILLIGGGSEYDKVKNEASIAGVLNRNLFMERHLPKKEIPAAINSATMASSLFVDKIEMQHNSANKFFDALAAGKPVFINYGGWQKELLESADAGIVTWGLTPEEAALKLSAAIADKNWLKRAGEASRKMAIDFFNRDVLATQLEQVLTAVYENNNVKMSKIAPGVWLKK